MTENAVFRAAPPVENVERADAAPAAAPKGKRKSVDPEIRKAKVAARKKATAERKAKAAGRKKAAAAAKAAAKDRAAARARPKHPPAIAAEAQTRHWGLLVAFAILFTVPVALASWYLYARAADQYASDLGFTVRSEDISSASDIFGTLGSTFGSASSRDTDVLYEYIRSQEIVSQVDALVDLRSRYAIHHDTDPLLSFDADGTIEDLTRYWRRMVQISYDAGSGLMEIKVLAFTAEDAKEIAEAIQLQAGARINELSAIAREDATRYARQDLELAVERLKQSREALTAFRIENQLVDVNADIQGQMGLLNTLQGQLAEALIEFDLLAGVARPGDPRLEQAQRRIDVIEERIDEERLKFGGGLASEGFATTVADFERLTVEREFAEQAYLAALSAYDGARAEANRQSLYLAAYIRPTLAQKSEYPRRLILIGIVALFGFLVWAVSALVYYSLRDSS